MKWDKEKLLNLLLLNILASLVLCVWVLVKSYGQDSIISGFSLHSASQALMSTATREPWQR